MPQFHSRALASNQLLHFKLQGQVRAVLHGGSPAFPVKPFQCSATNALLTGGEHPNQLPNVSILPTAPCPDPLRGPTSSPPGIHPSRQLRPGGDIPSPPALGCPGRAGLLSARRRSCLAPGLLRAHGAQVRASSSSLAMFHKPPRLLSAKPSDISSVPVGVVVPSVIPRDCAEELIF